MSAVVHPFDIPARLAKISLRAKALGEEVAELVTGRAIIIQCEHYNGQPYGRSKRPLAGERFVVTGAFVDEGGVHLWLGGDLPAIRSTDVDWVAEGEEA